ncbi:MAG: molecular chaperone HtpG [Ruminococcaceae bacterium]|nr:molecular chaperone HtpG [Oscillospiraceae bacterium]
MEENIKERGGISVETSHIFPVIKKWLYSEKEIFLRELVSNACDAVTKLKRLSSLGQYEGDGMPYRVDVTLDATARTLTVSDNGIGMSEDEVKKYICQIALSGALDFVEKYEGGDDKNGIIGHFGLGFYSAFMVAEKVEVITRSFTGSETVRFVCDENGSYAFTECDTVRERGTDVILHLGSEGEEYLSADKLKQVLYKYCAFMPVEIYFSDLSAENKEGEVPAPINDVDPLWQKNPSDVSEQEYKAFYSKVFGDYREPLFQIHINADYPLNFKGILYFPKIQSEYESLEGQVKLYYNQVFVADNIKEVIPEYLLMLRGVLDCPELPLNVSRSYLQNSGYVSRISSHITKKVADKLSGMFRNEREGYEKLWKDLKLFVEYGSLRDRKFHERMKDAVLLEKVDGSLVTFSEYKEAVGESTEKKCYYATDPVTQAQYVSLFENAGIPVLLFDKVVDTQYIAMLEQESDWKFLRIDAELADALRDKEIEEKEDADLQALFVSASGEENLKLKLTAFKDEEVPAVLNLGEEDRRMRDMMQMYGMDTAGLPAASTLQLNTKSSLVKKLLACTDEQAKKNAAGHIYLLALLSQRPLSADELKRFLADSYRNLENSL